jgi:hypothetical protein
MTDCRNIATICDRRQILLEPQLNRLIFQKSAYWGRIAALAIKPLSNFYEIFIAKIIRVEWKKKYP